MIRVQASHIPYGLRGILGVACLVNLSNCKKDVYILNFLETVDTSIKLLSLKEILIKIIGIFNQSFPCGQYPLPPYTPLSKMLPHSAASTADPSNLLKIWSRNTAHCVWGSVMLR